MNRWYVGIDPGTTQSAWAVYDRVSHKLDDCSIDDNELLLRRCQNLAFEGYEIAIEMVACYGMPVGAETFETVRWIGRFEQALRTAGQIPALVYRKDIKLHFCHSARAKDPNVRQAIIDSFPGTGGGKCGQVGTKSRPGPLFGARSHIWPALAVAMFEAAKVPA